MQIPKGKVGVREVKSRVISRRPWLVRSEQGMAIKASLRGHDRICTRRSEATVDARVV